MANIKIESVCPLYDGMPVTFKAPCDCTAVTGLKVCYDTTAQTFTFRDAHGNDLTGIGNLFAAGAYVKAILDTTSGYAYLQNADTNKYLEDKIGGQVSGIDFSNWGNGAFSVVLYDGTTAEGAVTFDSNNRPTSITVNGKTLALTFPAATDDGGDDEGGDSADKTITFTALGAQCTAEDGMTWAEWVASDYYAAGSDISVSTDGVVVCPVGYLVLQGASTPITYGTDAIVSGGVYDIIGGGGEGGPGPDEVDPGGMGGGGYPPDEGTGQNP